MITATTQTRKIEGNGRVDHSSARKVVMRTAGSGHGSITRLMSPGDLGQMTKPFVFLDAFDVPPDARSIFRMHPHSGIATLTYLFSGSAWINDTVGTKAVLNDGDIEWMRASGGAWHESGMDEDVRLAGLQLWLALPPHLENATPDARHIVAADIPRVGPVRVLLGTFQGVTGPVPYDEGVNYLHVELPAGATWEYSPPEGHTTAWIYVHRGAIQAGGDVISSQLAVFDKGGAPIRFSAVEASGFVVGSAVPHGHDLILGPYSVHTSAAALAEGHAEISRIGATLRGR